MKRLVQCASVVAALAFSAAPANAAVTSWTFSGCGGNSFSTCFSVNAFEENGLFVVEVTNDGSNGAGTFASTFAEIGFSELPFDMTGLDHFTGDGSWVYDDNLTELNGVIVADNFSGGNTPPPPPQNGLHDGETVTFYFTFDGTFDLTGGIFGLHGIQGPNGCSTKVFTTVGGTPNQPSGSAENCTPDTSVPEPITMTLLGTGLVGMGGANMLRRRRKNEDDVV